STNDHPTPASSGKYAYVSAYHPLSPRSDTSKRTVCPRPSASRPLTSTFFTLLAHCGYASKSAITAITALGSAAIVILPSVRSAMAPPFARSFGFILSRAATILSRPHGRASRSLRLWTHAHGFRAHGGSPPGRLFRYQGQARPRGARQLRSHRARDAGHAREAQSGRAEARTGVERLAAARAAAPRHQDVRHRALHGRCRVLERDRRPQAPPADLRARPRSGRRARRRCGVRR